MTQSRNLVILDNFLMNETGKILYVERGGDSRKGVPQGESQNGTKFSEIAFRLES